MAKLYVSVDRNDGWVKLWTEERLHNGHGIFLYLGHDGPIISSNGKKIATDCHRGECREVAGESLAVRHGKLVIPTVKPRTVEDVKEEIVQKSVAYFGDADLWSSQGGGNLATLVAELRDLQAKEA